MVSVSYHQGDAFANAVASARFSYYGVTGTPTVKLDGDYGVVGGMAIGTMYPTYRSYFDQHKSVPSPFDIGLACRYDSTSRQGNLEIVVRNTTSSAVSGQLQVVLCENHIYYPWGNEDSVQFVARDMYPDASGEAIAVPANDSVTRTRNFTVNPAWVARNCHVVVFVQNNSSKAMYQGSRIGLMPIPGLAYRGYQPAHPVPNSDVNLVVGLRNIGMGDAQTVSGVLSTADPYVTVTTPNASFPDIAVAADGYSTTPYVLHIAENCPDPHLATLDLAISAANGYSNTVGFPMNVSVNTGFSDDMERGDNGWTHSGTGDAWHQTAHRSQSPSHAWYCGTEGSWVYPNQTDMSLMTPYFTVGDTGSLQYDHWYATENTYDFCLTEVSNGGPFWWQLASYTGTNSGWQHQTFPLGAYEGQTLRCRFRFLSDYNVNDEGWYVDNFVATPYTTGVEESHDSRFGRVAVNRTPVRDRAELSYLVPPGRIAALLVYDAGGRLMARMGENLTGAGVAIWDFGDRVHAGTYFVRLVGVEQPGIAKLVVAK